MNNFAYYLVVGAAQEVAVPQHTVQPLGPQAVLEHVGSTVNVSETCGTEVNVSCCVTEINFENFETTLSL